MRRDRFAVVTFENQLILDINKVCCARECMSRIGKEMLRSLGRYYLSLTSDEQDTYLTIRMQMVSDIFSHLDLLQVLSLLCATML